MYSQRRFLVVDWIFGADFELAIALGRVLSWCRSWNEMEFFVCHGRCTKRCRSLYLRIQYSRRSIDRPSLNRFVSSVFQLVNVDVLGLPFVDLRRCTCKEWEAKTYRFFFFLQLWIRRRHRNDGSGLENHLNLSTDYSKTTNLTWSCRQTIW